LDYSDFEIILSDGGSTDRTVELAEPYVDKLIIENEVPEGWIGKNWGCHLGYKKANGSLLLFTDADTVHQKQSLKITVQKLHEKKTGLLSMLPYQIILKWWESIVAIYFFFASQIAGGIMNINNPQKKDSFFAVGQYLLFTRDFYEEIGGHEYIKGSLVEDYAFSRIAKYNYNSLCFMNNYQLVQTTMYPESPKQCWGGWKKSLFAGMKVTPKNGRLLLPILNIVWALSAPVAVVLAILYGNIIVILSMISTYILYATLLWNYWKQNGKHHWVIYTLYPLLMVFFLILFFNSVFELTLRKKITWKGRSYTPDLLASIRKSKHKKKDKEAMIIAVNEKSD
jgi:cellulose synthase/poly-beta-1,6-N-acetylglucosamine synthase-like glycosyltransferase